MTRCKRSWTAGCFFAAALSFCLAASAEVKPAPVFASHMVLQRDMPLPVWGTATAGETVVVHFRGQQKQTVAQPDGRWMVRLDPEKAGGPDPLQIGPVRCEDVLVGEVWVGAGQSNMVVGPTGFAKTDPVLASLIRKDYPLIRIGWGNKGDWRAPKAPVSLPALPFAFAVRLQEKLNVPVGVVLAAVPGSSTDFWLTPEAIRADDACRSAIAAYARDVYPRERAAYEARLKKWEAADPATRPTARPEPPLEPGAARHEIGKFFRQYTLPLIPFAMRGVLWDQGENGPSIAGTDVHRVMHALVCSWRKEWGRGDFPWVYMQKPSGGGCAFDPADPLNRLAAPFEDLPAKPPLGGQTREQFVRMLDIPGTTLVVTSDLSPGVHPPIKSAYGARAAGAAAVAAYGEKSEILGPLYAGCAVEGGRIRVRFTHVGRGLTFRHGTRLQGFVIAGRDRRFVWADAVIDGQTVLVSSPTVPEPVAVRYAYDAKCAWANLFNLDGLPALTFRSDEW